MSRRVLHRPPQGWDRRPNHALPDLIAFVAMAFGSAMFFQWTSSAFGMILDAAGL